jgi:vancomycin resistance protein YoaR
MRSGIQRLRGLISSGGGGSDSSGYAGRSVWRARRGRRRALGIAALAVLVVIVTPIFVSALPGGGEDSGGAGADEVASKTVRTQQNSATTENAGAPVTSPEPSKAEPKESQRAAGSTAAEEKPKMTASESSQVKLGEYETDYRYSDSEARKENLKISSGAVNGTVVEPGEVFSMNEHIAGLDYKKAKVFADGGETSALGGGLCQVTSTVYMAAQYAGLDIVERNAHYTVLPYIRPGFDATVWFGGQGIPELDMKFENTTDSNILIREYVTEKGILKAEIWGQPNDKEVTMRSEQDFKDTDRGIKWSTYKTVKEEGQVTQEGLLHEDLYSYPPPESVGDEGYNDVRVGGWSSPE